MPYSVSAWTVTLAPTCTANGEEQGVCTVCGQTQAREIDILPHSFGEWVVTKEPSGKRRGTRTRTCTNCSKIETERFFYEGTLYEEMERNEAVRVMQQMLMDCGLYGGTVKGGFGPMTGESVKRFQKIAGMERTGVATLETLEALHLYWQQAIGLSAIDQPSWLDARRPIILTTMGELVYST